MKKVISFVFAAALAVPSVLAYLTPEDARRMAEDGDTAGAIEVLKEFLENEPKNAEGRLLLGQLAWATGQDALAESTLEVARRQGNRDALLQLASMAMDTYRFDRAEELLDSYTRTNAGKRGRKAAPVDERAALLRQRLERLRGLMARVEKIAVIDSINVDADAFLSAYRLSAESGRIGFTSELSGKPESESDGCTYFIPQSGRQKIWAAESDGENGGEPRITLFQADAFSGGEWDKAMPLDPMGEEEGDVSYPFMLPDGITLYYAFDGESSLGGYDIYMARRTEDGFLEPVNLGMPYNSPFNDYMMAIDEFTGVGWFASDRNRIPGKVTVYLFVPSEMRVNVDADDPDLRARALLSPISVTVDEDNDYLHLLEAVRRMAKTADSESSGIRIYIPGRGLVTSYSQLPDNAARHAARLYTEAQKDYAAEEARLRAMRLEYARGNESSASAIRELEESLDTRRVHLTTLLNKVVRASE